MKIQFCNIIDYISIITWLYSVETVCGFKITPLSVFLSISDGMI